MKTPKKILAAFIVIACTATAAQAEGIYAGAKIGLMMADPGGFDDATNVGVVIGYAFADYANGPAVEFEYTGSVSDGDLKISGVKGDWDVDTIALYGAYRFGDALYGKVKAGYLREDVSASIAGVSFDGSDSGFSAGIGGGFMISDGLSIEAEYTIVEQDLDFLSIGLNVTF